MGYRPPISILTYTNKPTKYRIHIGEQSLHNIIILSFIFKYNGQGMLPLLITQICFGSILQQSTYE